MDADSILRKQLLELLDGRNAHMQFKDAVAGFPLGSINTEPPNSKHTPWRLLEHMHIAQWDILEFVRNPKHVSPPWPEGYWPPEGKQAAQADWDQTLKGFREDLQAIHSLVEDPNTDLSTDLPHAPGYTVLREVLVLADHNAFHLGEFALMRGILGAWE